MLKEGSDDVFDLGVRELEVVALPFKELDAAGLIETLQTDPILLVEFGVLNWENSSVSLKLGEPGSFLGINHGIVREHDQHGSVEA